jgi:hypothetical protein
VACLFLYNYIESSQVYRVNWLRAKARFDRWDEELITVRHEMGWSVTWFEHQRKKWVKRASNSQQMNKPGHCAYAEKQVALWGMFMQEAELGFEGKMLK